MLFSELYSAYYNTVAEILKCAVNGTLDDKRLKAIVADRAFGESLVTIPDALKSGRWPLLTADCKTPIRHEPTMPLTILQRRWLKAISLDPRIGLFDVNFGDLSDVEPLFTPSDITVYDRYADGDDYTDPGYIQHFRIIVRAIQHEAPLHIELADKNGRTIFVNVYPEYLEYSEKDDKFRLITLGCRYCGVIKLASIRSCRLYQGPPLNRTTCFTDRAATVTFLLYDGRNTLERAMFHFAHFEKTVEKVDDAKYRVTVTYDVSDETELLIRVLSFGPFIKVIEPAAFVSLIRERLEQQLACGRF